jgi:Icc-related predicted phosphoesterase
VIRVAAVGDIHLGEGMSGTYTTDVAALSEAADLLLLAGDLTRHGTVAEAAVVAAEFAGAPVPVVAVLGNHDLNSDEAEGVTAALTDAGITVLDGDGIVVDVAGVRVGVAGTVGFGGGFVGATVADFGEPEFKAFAARARLEAARLAAALASLDTDLRIGLTHYAPVRETLEGEPPEIYPFLGSHLLADVLDANHATLSVHGHAHAGSPEGTTPGGVPVRNVARPVIKAPYRVLTLDG